MSITPQLEQQTKYISTLTTLTMTTTTHPFNHSDNPHLFNVAIDVQPDGTSTVDQTKDKHMTAHRIDRGIMHVVGDAILIPQIHGKPNCAFSHSSGPSILDNHTTTITKTTCSTTSFSTTTITTATEHHLTDSFNGHPIHEMLVVQPDGRSAVHQIEDVSMANPINDILTKHRFHHTAHTINGMITEGLDIAIITMRAKSTSIIFGISDQTNDCLYTHSRQLRRLSTVSGELLLVERESWLYPSFRGRVDTWCHSLIGRSFTSLLSREPS